LIASLSVFGLDKSRELENQRIDFIKSSLEEKNIAYEERSLFQSQGGFGRSIHVICPSSDSGEGNLAEQFVLAVPLSTIEDTEENERFDIQIALHIAERLKNDAPSMNVRIVFLGDEYNSLPEDVPSIRNIGLADLFSLYDTPENVIIVYLDLPIAPDRFVIHHGSNGTIAPLNILNPLTDAFEDHSIPYFLSVKYNELYKLRLIKSQKALEIIQSMDFPGLLIKGSNTSSEPFSAALSAPLCAEAITSYIETIKVSTENYDTHYSLINLFNKTIYINELFTVLSFLAVGFFSLILLLIYSLTHRHMLVIQSRVFLKRSWIILLHFIILAGSLFASNLIYILIRNMVHIPASYTDYISVVIKIFIALCFYNLCVPLFYRLWIPRKDRFYGNAAVALVVIGTVVAVFLDITFVPIFQWSFIFTLMGTIITQPWIVLFCTLVVPFQIIAAFITVIYSDSPSLAILMASNNVLVPLFIACIALPEILMANRIVLLFRRGRSDPKIRQRTILQLSIIAMTIVLFIGLGILMTRQVPHSPYRETVAEQDSAEQVLQAHITSMEYLDRRVLSLSMNALGNPKKFSVTINNMNKNIPLVIYDSPVPFERLNEDNTIVFHLGERPDNPFQMEIVLPAELQCMILAEALYTEWDSTIDAEKPENTDDYLKTYTVSLPIPE
jgi:hypothetical protein